MPLCDHTGTPTIPFDGFRHFCSSTISGSAARMSARMRVSVSSRQSRGLALLAAIEDAFVCVRLYY
jgi:hypothetical protein